MSAEIEVGSVFVTGANRGIGLGFVKQFLALPKPPKYVFAGCRNPDDAEALKTLMQSKENLKVIKLDVGDNKSITSAAQQVAAVVGDDGLNVLINNAGVMGQFMEVNPDDMMHVYRVNALGPFLMSKAFTPLLKKAAKSKADVPMSVNRAAIFTISTHVGSIAGAEMYPGLYGYKASKAAVNMLIRSLSMELKKDKILMTLFCPGIVSTDMTAGMSREGVTKMTPEETVLAMMKLMANFKESDTGKFYNYEGLEVAW